MRAEAHPEPHVGVLVAGRQAVNLVMAGQIGGLLADDRQVPFAPDLEHLVLAPRAALPAVNRAGELAEVDLGVEVGGEVAPVRARVDVHDVDRGDLVEIFVLGQPRIGVDDARIEARAQDCGDARRRAGLAPLPFVVAVPRRRLADLGRVLVDGGVNIGRARVDAALKHGHVDEGRAHVDDDPRARVADQRGDRARVHRVQRVGGDGAAAQMSPGDDVGHDGVGPRSGPVRHVDVAEFVGPLRDLVGHDIGHATGADDEDVGFFHRRGFLSGCGQGTGALRTARRGSRRSRRSAGR